MSYLFELHLTFEALAGNTLVNFEQFCVQCNVKPLIIALERGLHQQQPMISKVFKADSWLDAQQNIEKEKVIFENAGFKVIRTKVETPLEIGFALFQKEQLTPKYWEWHGKLELRNKAELLVLIQPFGAHLSRNALKGTPTIRFVTLRNFKSAKSLEENVADLTKVLNAKDWHFQKQEFECCIYDDKEILDKGWLVN